MNNILWIIYGAAVLGVALVVGLHLGRFRAAYTEMTGMMAGMAMGMLNGFLVGYAASAATSSMFWGNLVGMPLGLLMGVYYGRAGGLMGVMDGGLGGAMGGSMGAMLAAMLAFPTWAMDWTGLLLVLLYVPGMLGLVLLIERSAPGHAALHRLLPFFTRAISTEVHEELESPTSRSHLSVTDYYALLGIAPGTDRDRIAQAYLEKLAASDADEVRQAEIAFATLTDPHRRRAYDALLAANRPVAGGYSPARMKQTTSTVVSATLPPAVSAATVRVKPRASRQTRPANTTPKERTSAVIRRKEPPISWVGVTAGIVTLGVLGVWWLATQGGTPVGAGSQAGSGNGSGTQVLGYVNNERNLPETEVRKLEAKAVTVPVASDGKQNVDLTVVGDTMSYKPRVLKVKKGVPVHFNISVEGRDPGCGRFVAFRGLGAHGLAEPGQVTTAEFTASATGVYEINCGMEMMEPGYILVTE
ncbi:MAG TPA: cupredoxin domain-containing protein [Chloroflexia bacterium]|jgi:plastocyanin